MRSDTTTTCSMLLTGSPGSRLRRERASTLRSVTTTPGSNSSRALMARLVRCASGAKTDRRRTRSARTTVITAPGYASFSSLTRRTTRDDTDSLSPGISSSGWSGCRSLQGNTRSSDSPSSAWMTVTPSTRTREA